MNECTECGLPVDHEWGPHTEKLHRAWRKHLYEVVWMKIGREVWRRATGE